MAAPPFKYGGILRISGNPSAAMQSQDGLELYKAAIIRYKNDHHQLMVEFL
jgi:hypothetical protein